MRSSFIYSGQTDLCCCELVSLLIPSGVSAMEVHGWGEESYLITLSFVLPFHLHVLFFSCPSQLSLHYDAECYAYVIMYLFLSFLPKMVL